MRLMRKIWMYGCFVLSLVCFVMVTVQYGWLAALKVWNTCGLFTSAVILMLQDEIDEEAEESPKGGGKE